MRHLAITRCQLDREFISLNHLKILNRQLYYLVYNYSEKWRLEKQQSDFTNKIFAIARNPNLISLAAGCSPMSVFPMPRTRVGGVPSPAPPALPGSRRSQSHGKGQRPPSAAPPTPPGCAAPARHCLLAQPNLTRCTQPSPQAEMIPWIICLCAAGFLMWAHVYLSL